MASKPDDLYGNFGSVPDNVSGGGSGAGPMQVHADANAFGGQVGQAISNAGQEAQKVGSQDVDLAIKQQGMINETAATNAESLLIQKNSAIRADFLSSEGQDAVNKQQPTLDAYNANYQAIRSSLSGGALRQFDMLGIRRLANDTSETVNYGTTQLKKAHFDSLLNGVSLHQDPGVTPMDSPDVVAAKVGNAIGNTTFMHQSMVDSDNPDIVKDPITGNHSFADTDGGNLAKANLQGAIDQSKGAIWQNAINSVSSTDPLKASQIYNDHKDDIPPLARAKIEASLAPRVTDAYVQGATNNAMTEMHADYAAMVAQHVNTNAPDSYSSKLQTLEGSGQNPDATSSGKYQFTDGTWISDVRKYSPQHANDTDAQILTLKKNDDAFKDQIFNAHTQADVQELTKSLGRTPTDSETYLAHQQGANGAHALISNPNQNAISALTAAGVKPDKARDSIVNNGGTADMTAGDFVSKWDDRYNNSGGKPNLPGVINPNYPKNIDGSRTTSADYFAANRFETLKKWDDWAEQQMPGNATFRNAVKERINGQINQTISDQAAQYHQDNNYVMKGVSGQLSNGAPPQTWDALYALPGMKQVLDRVPAQDPKFSDSIPTLIARYQRHNDNVNSPNAYETIQRVLTPNDNTNPQYPNGIRSQDQLDKLMGRSDGTGINVKDYNDAKKSLDSSDDWKNFLSGHMKSIANANGNVDGLGRQRALAFYNYANKVKDEKTKNDVAEADLVNPDSKEYIGNFTATYTPSRMQQISTWASNLFHRSSEPAKVTDAASYNAIPSGTQYTDPGGVLRTKP